MRKVDDGEKKEKEKIMTFIVATKVVASRPPERRPTGTPTARAKSKYFDSNMSLTLIRLGGGGIYGPRKSKQLFLGSRMSDLPDHLVNSSV